MTKLLILTTVADTVDAFLLPFIKHFRDRGWQVDIMAQGVTNFPRCQELSDRVWEIEWSRNPLDPKNLLVVPQKIRNLVVTEGYDIVHVHTPVAAFVTRYALKDIRKKQKTKIIYTAHGFHFYKGANPLKSAIFLTLEKIAGAWTDYLVTINREDEIAAKHYKLLPPERVIYMPGIGVDLSYYNREAVSEAQLTQLRQEMAITSETPLFLCIAEFIPRKRHQDVLQAFKSLNRPEVHLAFAGVGVLQEEMKQLASKLGLEAQVHFLGDRTDIPVLLCAATATILVSQQEGLPRSVMESLSFGVPVIGTAIRGTQDLLEGGNGLLLEVGDIAGIKNAMAFILDNPQEGAKMGNKSKNSVKKYQISKIIELHEQLYQI